jgi:pilus assembly protein Flp/PilA
MPREGGQGLVEYALILMLVAMGVIVVLSILGTNVSAAYSGVVAALQHEVSSEPEEDCYGSLLLPFLMGSTALLKLVFRLAPKQPEITIEE